MGKKLNKKGVFFTFISILVVTFVLMSVTSRPKYELSSRMNVYEARIYTLNNFVIDFDNNTRGALESAAKNAILGIVEWEILPDNNVYRGDEPNEFFAKDFECVVITGYLYDSANGQCYNSITDPDSLYKINKMFISGDKTLSAWYANYRREADKLSIELQPDALDFENNVQKISIGHISPWDIRVTFEFLDNTGNPNDGIIDKIGIAQWIARARLYNGFLNISDGDYYDPAYDIELGITSHKIVDNDKNKQYFNDESKIREHIDNSFYVSHDDAPSFLDRLQGKLRPRQGSLDEDEYETPNQFGIESFVVKGDADYVCDRYSSIDFECMNEQTESSYGDHNLDDVTDFLCSEEYDWFRFPNNEPEHRDLYRIKPINQCPQT